MRRSMWNFTARSKTEHVTPQPVRYDELDREILIRLLINLSAKIEQRSAETAQAAAASRQLQAELERERQARQTDRARLETRLTDFEREHAALQARAAQADDTARLADDFAKARADLEQTQTSARELERKLNEVTAVCNQLRTQGLSREESLRSELAGIEHARKQAEDAASFATATLAAANREHAAKLAQGSEHEREITRQSAALADEKAALANRLAKLDKTLRERETAAAALATRLAAAEEGLRQGLADAGERTAALERQLAEQRDLDRQRSHADDEARQELTKQVAEAALAGTQARSQLAAAEAALMTARREAEANREAATAEIGVLNERLKGLDSTAAAAAQLETERRQLREEIKRLTAATGAQARDLETAQREAATQTESLRHELDAARKTIDAATASAQDSQARLRQAAQREQDLQGYVARLTAELQEIGAKSTQQELKAGKADEALRLREADYAREREQLKQDLERLAAESKGNADLAQKVQRQLEAEQAKPPAASPEQTARIAELERRIQSLQSEAAAAQARQADLEQQVERSRQQTPQPSPVDERLRTQEADFARERERLTQAMNRLAAESRHNSELAVRLQKMLDAEKPKTQAEDQASAARLAKLAEENKALKAAAAEPHAGLIELQRQLAQSKTSYEEAQSSNRRKQDELSTALDDSRRALDGLKYQLSELLAERNALRKRQQTEAQEALQARKTLESDLAQARAALETTRTELKQTAARTPEAGKREAELKQQLASLANTAEALRRELDQTRNQAATLSTTAETAQREASAQSSELNQRVAELAAVRQQLGEERRRHEAAAADLDRELAAARGTVEQLTALVDTLRVEKTEITDVAREEIQRLQGRIDDAAAALQDANSLNLKPSEASATQ